MSWGLLKFLMNSHVDGEVSQNLPPLLQCKIHSFNQFSLTKAHYNIALYNEKYPKAPNQSKQNSSPWRRIWEKKPKQNLVTSCNTFLESPQTQQCSVQYENYTEQNLPDSVPPKDFCLTWEGRKWVFRDKEEKVPDCLRKSV